MADRQVTIKDVAKLAGVSTAVVSAARSGREHNNPVFEPAIRGMHDAAEEAGDVLLLADAQWIAPGSHLMSRMAGTGMVGGPEAAFSGPRVDGYLRAVADAGLEADRSLIRPIGYDPIVVGREVRELMTRAEPPTALIIDNITDAAAGLAALTDLGIRVPDDLSVVVYQDLPLADVLRPAPTTVRMPLYQAGARGYRTLRRMIDGGRARSAVVANTKPKLIDRGSTRRL